MIGIKLPPEHYTSGWKTDGSIRPAAEVNELGRRYAVSRDHDTLLEICRCFHPYLMKYLVMICRGHLPVIGVGARPSHVNSDSKQFIRYFMPKGSPSNKGAMLKAVRHFHLAFKGMEPEEVYDVLMEQLVTAINGYDPEYKLKIRRVAEKIDHELSKRKQFSGDDLNRHLDFNCHRHLKLLRRVGFLERMSGPNE